MIEYSKPPPRAAAHWDPDSRAMWESWREDWTARYMTLTDWRALLANVSAWQDWRQAGGMRADLLRVVHAEFARIRRLADERRQAEEAAQADTGAAVPDGLPATLTMIRYCVELGLPDKALRYLDDADEIIRATRAGEQPKVSAPGSASVLKQA